MDASAHSFFRHVTKLSVSVGIRTLALRECSEALMRHEIERMATSILTEAKSAIPRDAGERVFLNIEGSQHEWHFAVRPDEFDKDLSIVIAAREFADGVFQAFDQ